MTIRRSNPWPALADLFAALLVTTFAGLIVIDVGEKDVTAAGADPAALLEKIAVLNERLAEAEAQVDSLKADLEQATDKLAELSLQKAYLEEQLAKVSREGEERKERLAYFEKQVKNRGIDPPPCMLVDGRSQSLVEITVYPEGRLGVEPLDLGSFGHLAAELPGYQNLLTHEPIPRESFASIARPVFRWGRSTENSLGFECAFYARIVIKTESKEELATTLTYVNEYFYTQNSSEITAFYRRGER